LLVFYLVCLTAVNAAFENKKEDFEMVRVAVSIILPPRAAFGCGITDRFKRPAPARKQLG
jgi:hypothetical protein